MKNRFSGGTGMRCRDRPEETFFQKGMSNQAIEATPQWQRASCPTLSERI